RRWVGPEFVRDGSELALAEMIRGGQTCFNDNYFFPEVTAECARRAGLRATLGIPVLESPNPWTSDFAESLRRGEALADELADEPLLRVALAPHAPYSVSDPALARIREVAAARKMRIHMHVLETDWEIGHSKREFGLRPLQRLDQAGVLNEQLIAVHMTQLGGADIALLAERGVHVVHCPESNLKLASGICPVAALLDAGVNVALGTDGAASNNDLDLLGEARTAALLAKVSTGDPRAVPAATALDMLTMGGARALGIDAAVGSIEAGKQADLVAVDLDCLEAQPLHDVISQLVYAVPRSQVTDVWVAGRAVMRSRELLTLDEDALLATAAEWQQRLLDGERQVGGAAS
ncbi:MAG: amidohydrolase family protein, partial [Xanthomonadales bacterium]|nr:amidohydrolase family protein [Xanthomonadales bacterium]